MIPWKEPLKTLMSSITEPMAISLLGVTVCGGQLILDGRLGDFTRRAVMVIMVVALLMFALPADAAMPGGMPWNTFLGPFVAGFVGTPTNPSSTAVMVAIMSVAVVGWQVMWSGELGDWGRRTVMICLTVGLLYGSRTLLSALFGVAAAVIP